MKKLARALSRYEDAKLYDVITFSRALKEFGIPHNKATIKKYGESGVLKIGRLPNTQKMVILGAEIKRFIKSYLKKAGVI